MFGITMAHRNFNKFTVISNIHRFLQLYSFELLYKQSMCNFGGTKRIPKCCTNLVLILLVPCDYLNLNWHFDFVYFYCIHLVYLNLMVIDHSMMLFPIPPSTSGDPNWSKNKTLYGLFDDALEFFPIFVYVCPN